MTESKYFTTNEKGAIFELKAELNKEKKEEEGRRLTSALSTCTELYASRQSGIKEAHASLCDELHPESARHGRHGCQQLCEGLRRPNPLIQALAVRTVGCIQGDKITEYPCVPLCMCLKDEDLYVQETAAVCEYIKQTKLCINAQMVGEQGPVDSLQDLMADSNPMDPIYVKLEELNIMICLASQDNTTQRWMLTLFANQQSVRVTGQCAIKGEQSAERGVSTLLDLIQTKVNDMVQKATIVIRHIFCQHSKYESIIATLSEDLDYLDEPDAQAARIWTGLHDESTQVQLTPLSATGRLFPSKPPETQKMAQQTRAVFIGVFSQTDPVMGKQVVLFEKPLMSEETDFIMPALLDELICHTGSCALVHGIHRKHLSIHHGSTDADDSPIGTTSATNLEQPQVIPLQGDLLDLLALTLVPQCASGVLHTARRMDLLGGGLDGPPSPTPAVVSNGLNDLSAFSTEQAGDLLDVWILRLSGCLQEGAGLEISGTCIHHQGHTFKQQWLRCHHRSIPLANHTPLMPNQCPDVSLPLNTLGPFRCVFFVEDSRMEHQVFLATWKDIPNENELCKPQNNVYPLAKRNMEGEDMLYQSLKLSNGIWMLAGLHIQPGNPNYMLLLQYRAPEVSLYICRV
ncbi:unnamed protein product [Nyctereutes procyonoides]|uniref:(raccoon dog) hypothetical protein n=1 Tax=Nyctereutes procyonoides TaxID=34880 RepID=A0A811YDK6_NYCPR|nr:unnamed protein product [Nyctereutes procyonoides]